MQSSLQGVLGVVKSRKLTGAIAALLLALTMLVLATTTSAAQGSKHSGPRAGSSGSDTFSGIHPWGTGASHCKSHESNARLTIDCTEIQRNFVGSYVLIRFPNKEFLAHLQLAKDSAKDFNGRRLGVNWTKQSTAPVPDVYAKGVIYGSEQKEIDPSDIKPCTIDGTPCPGGKDAWDLGLDRIFGSSSGLPATVSAVITITRKSG